MKTLTLLLFSPLTLPLAAHSIPSSFQAHLALALTPHATFGHQYASLDCGDILVLLGDSG